MSGNDRAMVRAPPKIARRRAATYCFGAGVVPAAVGAKTNNTYYFNIIIAQQQSRLQYMYLRQPRVRRTDSVAHTGSGGGW